MLDAWMVRTGEPIRRCHRLHHRPSWA